MVGHFMDHVNLTGVNLQGSFFSRVNSALPGLALSSARATGADLRPHGDKLEPRMLLDQAHWALRGPVRSSASAQVAAAVCHRDIRQQCVAAAQVPGSDGGPHAGPHGAHARHQGAS